MTNAIHIEKLSKRYRLGLIGGTTLRDDWRRFWARFYGRPDPLLSVTAKAVSEKDAKYIWALRDLDLTFEEGRAVGIVGPNGAGKTTLLKILSRITAPTAGQAWIRGRVASLLEVGTGFHPELTGRENVYLNGAILGMTKSEVRGKFDEIVDFSGIEPFIETPVKRYSSGMRVRLAFAVAAHLEPEILLIDEVLSVGDAAFQKKCLGKMEEVTRAGRTVLFVSHQMAMVTALCERAILLEAGRVTAAGPAAEVVARYLEEEDPAAGDGTVRVDTVSREGSGAVRFVEWWIDNARPGGGLQVACGRGCEIHLRYVAEQQRQALRRVSVALTISDVLGHVLTTGWTRLGNADFDSVSARGTFTCRFEALPLVPGLYRVGLWCSVNDELADQVANAGSFEVTPTDPFGTGRLPDPKHHGPLVLEKQSWSYADEVGEP